MDKYVCHMKSGVKEKPKEKEISMPRPESANT